MPADTALAQRIERIEALSQAIDTWTDPAARTGAAELLQATLELHGAGLERLLDLAWEAGPAGQALIDTFTQDPLIGRLLLLHGLHPLDFETRVTQALEKVRPYMASHGGNVALLGVDDGVIRLRLEGSCHGCPSSALTLKLAVEEAIAEFAPDHAGLQVEGVVEQPPAPPASFIPLTQVRGPSPRPAVGGGRWERVTDIAASGVDGLEARAVDGTRIVFCRVAGQLYAYAAICPSCDSALEGARLEGGTLTCAKCGHTYDVMRAGRGLDRPDRHLEPCPLLIERGQVRVALPALAR